MTATRLVDSSRSAFIGKVLLWVIGIPLLIVVLAIAALVRHAIDHGRSAASAPPPQSQSGGWQR